MDWPAEGPGSQTAEAVDLVRRLWTATTPADFAGDHFRLEQAQATPGPLQQPHPPIWFGDTYPAQLRECARVGDGWNSARSAGRARQRLGLLREACDEVGRDVAELEIALETQVLVADDLETLRAQLAAMAARPGFAGESLAGPPAAGLDAFLSGESDVIPDALTDTWLIGTPDEVTKQVSLLRSIGVDHSSCGSRTPPRPAAWAIHAQGRAAVQRARCGDRWESRTSAAGDAQPPNGQTTTPRKGEP